MITRRSEQTHSPVFSPDGAKVAWLEMAEDGYEADEQRVVVYDQRVDVTYKLDYTRDVKIDGSGVQARWDRSPDGIKVRLFPVFCHCYLCPGALKKVKDDHTHCGSTHSSRGMENTSCSQQATTHM